ncbi:hypothetical protein NPIL_321931 [Nephila pilipes]|uniref:Uncharacterized protein n=1 Tax=Nephila pilipes TaxID=299642 RepID=A0A8X6UJM9_NEPPI|nr:hypothetical protein NPIL_321931 [Nephila pilipes]
MEWNNLLRIAEEMIFGCLLLYDTIGKLVDGGFLDAFYDEYSGGCLLDDARFEAVMSIGGHYQLYEGGASLIPVHTRSEFLYLLPRNSLLQRNFNQSLLFF